ncbi:MAG TPA: hypothetical protein VJ505_11550 [Holophagaceae bacterium]|nr:hypothetical protein [Holophagaceae bacterium]
MNANETFARRVFFGAGVYGLLALLPQYFLEGRVARDFPPAITHPEYFYGFIGVALAWQIAFLAIAKEPLRLRPVMIAAVLEKASFAASTLFLYQASRVAGVMVPFALIDLMLGTLFLISFFRCGNTEA